jgi:hypothetical protein
MNILPFALLASTLLLNHASLAQTAPPASPAAPAAPAAGTAPSGTNAATPGTAAAQPPTPVRKITVASLTTKDLRGQGDADLGDIERVVESSADKKAYVVVSRGGLLGFFGTEYLVPVDQIAVTGDRVVAPKMTQAALEGSTKFVNDAAAYRVLDGTQTVSVPEPR